MLAKIFISYRRDDSAGHAGRLTDRLESEFGRDLLFMDVDAIPLGKNFVKILHEEVAKCGVLLAVIGPNWLDARDDEGNRRLDNPHDFVRVEIAAALQRDIPVIPILLDGARIPRASGLPDDLKELALRNALDVRHASFHIDMDKLVRGLRAALDSSSSPSETPKDKKAEARQPGEKRREQIPDIQPPLRDVRKKIGRKQEESAHTDSVGIFVSYRRLDDAPPPDSPREDGFVSHLLADLRWELYELGVSNSVFWHDRASIEVGDHWSDTTLQALNRADLFIAIVSRNFVTSDWCRPEISAMESRAAMLEMNHGQPRILRVDKHPVPEDEIPHALRNIPTVRFYREDHEAKRVDEYFWRGKVRLPREYKHAVHKLAVAIVMQLRELGISSALK